MHTAIVTTAIPNIRSPDAKADGLSWDRGSVISCNSSTTELRYGKSNTAKPAAR
ncbi:MAG: hypothetical protein JXR97_13795 [Planctomycetes bacterium]|nr:hypothetical protein [Planctomycetota bacterium]